MMMRKDSRIFIAGAQTLVGSALMRRLVQDGYRNVTSDVDGKPVLSDVAEVEAFMTKVIPEYVFLTGGKSGGIQANLKYPAELLYDNLQVILNVIHGAYIHKVKKLLYLASSCCYPRQCPQPIREEYILTAPFEPTNEAYSVAKVAGVKMCQTYRQQYGAHFISVVPPNIFGPGDDFHPEDSHVMAALILKMHQAKETGAESVEIWGTGTPRREFVCSDDVADACLFLMETYDQPEPINAGGGSDLSIRELAYAVREVVGYTGDICFNTEKPDGMPVKLLDSGRLFKMGWKPKTKFKKALSATYDWYLKNLAVR